MKKMMIAAALALLVLARPAHAQDSAQVSPARMRAAEELMQATDMEHTYARMIDEMVNAQKQSNPMLAQHEAEFRAFFERYMGWNVLKADVIRIYAETYTEDELHQLAAFYRTPLGRRLLETLPEVSARSAQLGQQRVMEHMPELLSQMMGMQQPPPSGTPKKP